jgi:hypothetical protein
MALLLARLRGPFVLQQWGCSSGGNTTSNQFLNDGLSTNAPTTTEGAAQKPSSVNLELWRLVGAYISAGAQQCTMTARVNGVAQASTATTVGAAAGSVATDLASGVLVLGTDLLSILFKFGTADASTMRARAWLLGVVCGSF